MLKEDCRYICVVIDGLRDCLCGSRGLIGVIADICFIAFVGTF